MNKENVNYSDKKSVENKHSSQEEKEVLSPRLAKSATTIKSQHSQKQRPSQVDDDENVL